MGNKEPSLKYGVGWSQRQRVGKKTILKVGLEKSLEGGWRLEERASLGPLHPNTVEGIDSGDPQVHCPYVQFQERG